MKPDNTQPIYLYNPEKGTLDEQPTIKHPGEPPRGDAKVWDIDEYRAHLIAYEFHIASLRSILTTYKWEEGKELKENEDFFVLEARIARQVSEALKVDYKMLPLTGLVAFPIEKEIPAKLDSNPLAFYDPAVPIKSNEQEKEPSSIAETFAELRKLTGGHWDKVKCVCDALGRGKCDFNCPEHEENQPASPSADKEAVDDNAGYWKERCEAAEKYIKSISGDNIRYDVQDKINWEFLKQDQ